MREESHLDDMRAAIRGDFERLAERRGGQELMSPPPEDADELREPEASAEPTVPLPAPAREPVSPDGPSEVDAAREDGPEHMGEPEDEPELAQEAAVEPPPRSWLARLLGR